MLRVGRYDFDHYQTILEVRYDPAYMLWDRAGWIADQTRRLFKTFRHQNAMPNAVSYVGDDLYSFAVELERLTVSDFNETIIDKSGDTFSDLCEIVFDVLKVEELKRVGARHIYRRSFSTEEEAGKAATTILGMTYPAGRKFLNVASTNFIPSCRVQYNDGSLGIHAQLYMDDKEYAFSPPLELRFLKLNEIKRKQSALYVDVDFFTKAKVDLESFSVRKWLSGQKRLINRDIEQVLRLGISDG